MHLYAHQFLALLQKNFLYFKYNWGVYYRTILLSVCIVILLNWFTCITEDIEYKDFHQKEFDPHSSLLYARQEYSIIGYSPNSNPRVKYIMQRLQAYASKELYSLREYRFVHDLHYSIKNDILLYAICGIEFEDSLANNVQFPDEIKIKVRTLPKLRRLNAEHKYETWKTTHNFELINDVRRFDVIDSIGYVALAGYYSDGILGVLDVLYNAIINFMNVGDSSLFVTSEEDDIPKRKVKMQCFDLPSRTIDSYKILMFEYFPFFVTIQFLICPLAITRGMASELEFRIKIYLRVMGAHSLLNNLSWLTAGFLINLIVVIIFTIGTKNSPCSAPIFGNTDTLVLILVLLLYSCTMLSLCYPMSRIFADYRIAVCTYGIYYFLTLIPFLLASRYEHNVTSISYLGILFPNTAMAIAIYIINIMEMYGEGVTVSLISTNLTPTFNSSILTMLLYMAFQVCLHILIGIILDRYYVVNNGIKPDWLFGTHVPKKILRHKNSLEINFCSYPKEDIAIKVRHVYKQFNKKIILENLSFDIARNTLVGILGKNGVGKSLLVDIMVGVEDISNGDICYGDRSIYKKPYRENIGYCPSVPILEQYLTVSEQIYLMCKIKGIDSYKARQEAKKFMQHFKIQKLAKVRINELSLGIQTIVSIILAFCGNPKYIFLDNSDDILDGSNKIVLLNLIKTYKSKTTMIVTGNKIFELEEYIDAVLIMQDGSIPYVGSVPALMKHFKLSYVLNIKKKNLKTNMCELNCLLQTEIPDIEPGFDFGVYMLYILPFTTSEDFISELREKLEQVEDELGIETFSFERANLQNLYTRVIESNSLYKKKPPLISMADFKKRDDDDEWISKLSSLIYKYYITNRKHLAINLIKLAIPHTYLLLYMVPFVLMSSYFLPPIEFKLPRNSIVLLGDDKSERGILKLLRIQKYFKSVGYKFQVVNNLTSRYMIQKGISKVAQFTYLVGILARNESDLVLFNRNIYHASAIALHVYYTALMFNVDKETFNVRVFNHPVEIPDLSYIEHFREQIRDRLNEIINFGTSLVTVIITVTYLKDRETGLYNLPSIVGITKYEYWVFTYVADYLQFISIVASLGIPMFFIYYGFFDAISSIRLTGNLFIIIICFGSSILPNTYDISDTFDPTAPFFNIAFGEVYSTAIKNYEQATKTTINVQLGLPDLIYVFFPFYTLYTLLVRTYDTIVNDFLCKDDLGECLKWNYSEDYGDIYNYYCNYTLCKSAEICCKAFGSFLELGHPPNKILLLYLILHGIINIFGALGKHYIFKIQCKAKKYFDLDEEDESVIRTKKLVRSYYTKYFIHSLMLIRNVTVYFGKSLLLNGICLEIKPHECIGILCNNKGGEKNLFEIIASIQSADTGSIFVKGIQPGEQGYFKLLSISPELVFSQTTLTPRNLIHIIALGRGYRFKYCNQIADRLAEYFNYADHLDKPLKCLNSGHIKIITNSFVIIGDCPLMVFNNPTVGLDMETKFNILELMCGFTVPGSGKGILFTTKSEADCEYACTKLAFIIDGNVKCVATIEELNHTFLCGFYLVVSTDGHHSTILITKFIMESFTHVVRTQLLDTRIVFRVMHHRVLSLEEVYEILQKGIELGYYNEYRLVKATLGHLFYDYCVEDDFLLFK